MPGESAALILNETLGDCNQALSGDHNFEVVHALIFGQFISRLKGQVVVSLVLDHGRVDVSRSSDHDDNEFGFLVCECCFSKRKKKMRMRKTSSGSMLGEQTKYAWVERRKRDFVSSAQRNAMRGCKGTLSWWGREGWVRRSHWLAILRLKLTVIPNFKSVVLHWAVDAGERFVNGVPTVHTNR